MNIDPLIELQCKHQNTIQEINKEIMINEKELSSLDQQSSERTILVNRNKALRARITRYNKKFLDDQYHYKKKQHSGTNEHIAIYLLDVGSAKNRRTGWFRRTLNSVDGYGHYCLDNLIQELISDLNKGLKIALGFEYSMFFPIADSLSEIGEARQNEKSAWSGNINPLGIGMQQTEYIFRRVIAKVDKSINFAFLKEELLADANVLLWEAYVSGESKPLQNDTVSAQEHIDDAAWGVSWFIKKWNNNELGYDVDSKNEVFSIIGALLFGLRVKQDASIMREKCYVIKPRRE